MVVRARRERKKSWGVVRWFARIGVTRKLVGKGKGGEDATVVEKKLTRAAAKRPHVSLGYGVVHLRS